jgi:uncharacterized UPF0160 family protein
MKTIVTHSGNFHADDVCAVATLQLYYGVDAIQVVRTRDESVIATGDIVLDVGGVYDPEKERYDHHQGDAPIRDNGIPYAAFGLVWDKYGALVCGDAELALQIEAAIVIPIDAHDNAVSLYTPLYKGISPFGFGNVISSFLPSIEEEEKVDACFLEAVAFARGLLTRIIAQAKARMIREQMMKELYESATDKEVLVSPEPVNARHATVYPEVKLVISPRTTDAVTDWKVTAVPVSFDTFESRVQFPEAWRALRDHALQAVSGIPDAVFCHKTGYLCVVGSKESALRVARYVLHSVPIQGHE